jgi:hypothetical protein
MLHVPSWKWLSFRPTRELVTGDAPAPQSRPCLPSLEKLDDRLMLSVSTDASEVPPPNGDTQILIGLLKGQLTLVSHELNALKLAGALKLDVHKFNESLMKIDDVITDFGQAVLKEDLTAVKIDRSLNDLKVEFMKIDALVGGLGDSDAGTQLKVVLDTLDHKSSELIGLLNSATGAGDLDHKVELRYLKVSDSFQSLDDALLKVTEDAALARKAGKGQQEYLQIKLQDVIISSLKVEDPDVQGQLLNLEKLTAGLLQTGGGDFGGGVTTDGGTGDVLA